MAFTIDWPDFWPTNRGELPDDHDVIVASITRNVVGVSGVRIALGRAPNVSWWKGFALINAQGQPIRGIAGGQDADAAAERDYSVAEVAGAVRLELWKAKLLGVHTHTYTLTSLAPLTPGSVIEFHWVQDTGGIRNAQFASALFTNVQAQDNQARTFSITAGTNFQLQTRVNSPGSTIALDPALDFRIGSQNPQDNQTWGTNRWELGGVVLPDNGLNVTLDLRAPSQPGSYPLALRMVQDGVRWFGDTLEFTATVTAGGAGTPGRTCLLTGLAVGLGLLNPVSEEVMDGAREVRAQLQQSPPGARLVQLYRMLSEAGEVEALLRADARLLFECLSYAGKVAACASRTANTARSQALADTMPQFERIVGVLQTRSSEPTRQALAEVRTLVHALIDA